MYEASSRQGSLLLSIIGLLLVYLATTAFSRLFFSPLSKIPGPKLLKVTRLIWSYHRVRGNGEFWLHSLHKNYGAVVQYAPGEVSLADGLHFKSIYGHPPGSRLARMYKDPKLYGVDTSGVHLANAPDTVHPRLRKIFNPAFSDQAVARQEPLLQRYVDQLLENLDQADGKTDMMKKFTYVAFDVMADLTFGESLGCLTGSPYTAWVAKTLSYATALIIMAEISNYAWLHALTNFLMPASVKRDQEEHFKHSHDRVDKRLANKNGRPDIFGIIMTDENQGDDKLTLEELYATAQIFMFAGTETSATLMTALTYYLMTHPEKYRKAADEVRAAFASREEIKWSQVRDLPYLNACIEETFRMHPPVPMGLPRTVGEDGAEIDGYHLPPKTTVSVHMYSSTRNPRHFASADKFVPERWLKTGRPAEFENDELSAIQPFSYGPRNCIGINLANMEIRLVMANVLYSYDFTIADESRDWLKQRQFLMWEKKPLMASVHLA